MLDGTHQSLHLWRRSMRMWRAGGIAGGHGRTRRHVGLRRLRWVRRHTRVWWHARMRRHTWMRRHAGMRWHAWVWRHVGMRRMALRVHGRVSGSGGGQRTGSRQHRWRHRGWPLLLGAVAAARVWWRHAKTTRRCDAVVGVAGGCYAEITRTGLTHRRVLLAGHVLGTLRADDGALRRHHARHPGTLQDDALAAHHWSHLLNTRLTHAHHHLISGVGLS